VEHREVVVGFAVRLMTDSVEKGLALISEQ
jgi:hypothetical protein